MEPMGTLWGSAAGCSQHLKGELSVESVKQLVFIQCPQRALAIFSSSFSLSYSCAVHHSFLDRVRRKWMSLAVSCTAVEAERLLTCPYFSS